MDAGPLVAWFCPKDDTTPGPRKCCTVDGDFRVFRRLGREAIPLIAPFC